MKNENVEIGFLYVDKYGSIHQLDDLGKIIGIANEFNYIIIFSHKILLTREMLSNIFPHLNITKHKG